MALVVCSDCGNNISDRAPNCPNCGAPNEQLKVNPLLPTPTSVLGNNQRSCPQCTTVMGVGRRLILSIFLSVIALTITFISIPFVYNIIVMIVERGASGVKWEIAGAILIVPFLGLYLLARGIRYSQPHLMCPKCKKELWD